MEVNGGQRTWVECDLCTDEIAPEAPHHIVPLPHQRALAPETGPRKALLCDACVRAVTLYAHSGEGRQVQREANSDLSHVDGGKWFLSQADVEALANAERCREAQRPVVVRSDVKEDA